MSKRWHDISETGDPQDLPTENKDYWVTVKSGMHNQNRQALTLRWEIDAQNWEYFHPTLGWTTFVGEAVAWREMPRAYDPNKRKPKPLMFEHDVTLKCVAPVHPGSYPVLADNGERVADILWRTVDILLGKHAAIRTNEANGKPVHFKIYLTEIEQDKQ